MKPNTDQNKEDNDERLYRKVRKVMIFSCRFLFLTGGLLLFLSIVYNPELIKNKFVAIIIVITMFIDLFLGSILFADDNIK